MSWTTISGILTLIASITPIIISLINGTPITHTDATMPLLGAAAATGLYKAADAPKNTKLL